MSLRIRIISPDIEYINKIVGKLASRIKSEIQLEYITDEKCFVESRNNPKRVNVEFIDEAFLARIPGKAVADNTFVISENANNGEAVNKLEGSEAILRVLGEGVLKTNKSRRQCQIVAVSSPYGGSGKTTVALAIAARLSQLHRRVLYIDAENAQNYYEKLDEKEYMREYASKELAASIVNLTTSSYENIKKHIAHGLFDYMPPFEKYLFHYHLTPNMLNDLAKTMAVKKEYDYIIVEQESVINPDLVQEIMGCTRHVVVTNRSMDDLRLKKYLALFDGFDGYTAIIQNNYGNEEKIETDAAPVAEKIALDLNDSLGKVLEKGYYRKAAEAVL